MLHAPARRRLAPRPRAARHLDRLRRTIGEYNFAGQYQQSPAPLGGGLVKAEWFKRYRQSELPERFDRIVQSWDTANKETELSDFSVCTTWGVKDKELFLLAVFRQKLEYPRRRRLHGCRCSPGAVAPDLGNPHCPQPAGPGHDP